MSFNLIPVPEWIETEQQAYEAGKYLLDNSADGIGFDTETTGTDIAHDIPLLGSLSDGRRRFAFWMDPWARYPWIYDAILMNPNISKVGTKIKFDAHMCANIGINIQGPLEDTLVMDWLYDENRSGRHGLKETAKDHLGIVMREFKEIFPMRKGKKATKKHSAILAETAGDAIRRVMNDPEERKKGVEYAGLDAYGSMVVRNFLRDRLSDVEMTPGRSLWQHFQDTETVFTRVLYNIERRGFCISLGHLRAQMAPMEKELKRLESEIAMKAGWPVNINSPKQLATLFYQQLGYPVIKWTDGGKSGKKQPCTDYDVMMAQAAKGCPISRLIVQYREYEKSYSTYVVGLASWVDANLRIHTTLNQHVTVTGRLSSVEPNLQNIPRPKGDKFKIREAFIAEPGKRLVVNDYDQLEMKIMAHFSQDPGMLQAIRDGMDLHCYTVALMYGENYEEVYQAKKASDRHEDLTPRQLDLLLKRQSAKSTGFGLIYGIGPDKLAAQLTEELKLETPMTREQARALINRYFAVFPGVRAFILDTHARCKAVEYVQTLTGRFRRLPSINARGGGGKDGDDGNGIVAEAKRQSVNSIIQGTAADIAKAAMIQAEYDPVLAQLGARLLLQIHDELIWECDDDEEVVMKVKKRAREIMEHPFGPDFALSVPLTVGGESGYSWAEAK